MDEEGKGWFQKKQCRDFDCGFVTKKLELLGRQKKKGKFYSERKFMLS